VWIWDTRNERVCDTLEWFPSTDTLPLASSVDLIIAAANNIVHALNHPSAGSPLAPLADIEVETLRSIAEILTNRRDRPPRTAIPTAATTPTESHKQVSFAPTVLAPTQNQPASTLRVQKPVTIAHPEAASPLRVASPTLLDSIPSTDTWTVVTRKNKTKTSKATTLSANPPTTAPTHQNSTGPVGQRRRRQQRRLAKTTPHARPAPAVTATPTHGHSTRSMNSQLLVSPSGTHHSASKAIHADTGVLSEYRKLRKSSRGEQWEQAAADKFGRLTQGNLPHMLTGTNTMAFIRRNQVPHGRRAVDLKIVSADKPNKAMKERIRFTVHGDQVEYPDNVSTKTAALTAVKILLNSVFSTPGAEFLTGDIENFYLNNVMKRKEYMRIPIGDIPQTIIDQYNLLPLVSNGYVYVEIGKGMYGLPQAGKIANDRLIKHLAEHGYEQAQHTHGLFTHKTNGVVFTLVVNDFGVKYVGRENAEHLMASLREIYSITAD
jgi:hypothetical protein